MLISCVFIVIGLMLLVYGADMFVTGASSTARQFGMSPLIIGLTIVGFATSAPEIIVGSVSAWQHKTSIAIGNALGSNITNIGLVLGVAILLLPITVRSDTIKREYGLMLLSILVGLLLMLDGHLGRLDAIVLLAVLVISIGGIVQIAKHSGKNDPLKSEFTRELYKTDSIGTSIGKLIAGLVLLLIGAELLVRGAVFIAESVGISDLVIGLTIIAVGTSLPELATSIISILKKEADIAIGNIIGSSMFNMLAVLSIPVLIHPDHFENAVLIRDFPVLIGLSLLLGGMIFISSRGKLKRFEGALLLLCFIAYQYLLFSQSVTFY